MKLLAIGLIGLLFCISCSKKSKDHADGSKVLLGAPINATDAEPPTVRFDVKLASTNGSAATEYLYDCVYSARGKTARFGLELKYAAPKGGGLPIARAEGKFITVSGSDNSMLLEDLKAALLAKKLPTNVVRVRELPFDAAVLGKNQSENPGGGFSDKPAGEWVVIKVFLPKEGDDGEFFLNINPVIGKGEISIKDEEYGDYLLLEFAKVL